MSKTLRNCWSVAPVALATALALSGCGMTHDRDEERGEGRTRADTQQLTLSGDNEVPALSTPASGSGWVMVTPDRSVSAKIVVIGMVPTAAHIHEGAAGANGPVIVAFTKEGDDTFVAPPGAMLTESQYESLRDGNLYVNVHSAKSPAGEIRGQLRGR